MSVNLEQILCSSSNNNFPLRELSPKQKKKSLQVSSGLQKRVGKTGISSSRHDFVGSTVCAFLLQAIFKLEVNMKHVEDLGSSINKGNTQLCTSPYYEPKPKSWLQKNRVQRSHPEELRSREEHFQTEVWSKDSQVGFYIDR